MEHYQENILIGCKKAEGFRRHRGGMGLEIPWESVVQQLKFSECEHVRVWVWVWI